MKKRTIYGLIASVSMVSAAAYADPDASSAALTTKGYVDAGLQYVYGIASGASNGAVKDLQDTVGDSNSGLVKDVDDIQTALGDGNGGLVDVSALESTVGDSNSGLVKDVADLKTTVGDSTGGLVKRVNDLESSSIVYNAGSGIAVTPGANSGDPSTISLNVNGNNGIAVTPGANGAPSTVGLNISNVQNNTTYVYSTNGSGVGSWSALEVEDSWDPSFLTNP